MKTEENTKDVIVINKMYVGDYLNDNLGHEVINMYTADNGKHYLYLNAIGNFSKEHKDKVGNVLLVKNHFNNEFEIVGYATGITDVYDADDKFVEYRHINEDIYRKQIEYINKEKITYGKVPLWDIFNGDEQQSVFITYMAEKVYIPKKRMFIRYGSVKNLFFQPQEEDGQQQGLTIVFDGYNYPSTSLKSYIYPEGTHKEDQTLYKKNLKGLLEGENVNYENVKEIIIEARKSDYIRIKQILDNKDLWVEASTDEQRKKNKLDGYNGFEKIEELDSKHLSELSIFDICKIQNNEICFSAALEYFMKQKKYMEMWCRFFKEMKVGDLEEKYSVKREFDAEIQSEGKDKKNGKVKKEVEKYGRIDLLVEDDKNVILIENKIKSDINKKESDGQEGHQLKRYSEYINLKYSNYYNKFFFILVPEYAKQNMLSKFEKDEKYNESKDVYKVITYKDIYEFLKQNHEVWDGDVNMHDFYNAMKRHTYETENEYLYHEMQEKLDRRLSGFLVTASGDCPRCGKSYSDFGVLTKQGVSFHCDRCNAEYELCPDCIKNVKVCPKCGGRLLDSWEYSEKMLGGKIML